MSANALKWIGTFLLAFGGGAIQAVADGHAGAGDCLRHGLIALLPTIGALKMILDPPQVKS